MSNPVRESNREYKNDRMGFKMKDGRVFSIRIPFEDKQMAREVASDLGCSMSKVIMFKQRLYISKLFRAARIIKEQTGCWDENIIDVIRAKHKILEDYPYKSTAALMRLEIMLMTDFDNKFRAFLRAYLNKKQQ